MKDMKCLNLSLRIKDMKCLSLSVYMKKTELSEDKSAFKDKKLD